MTALLTDELSDCQSMSVILIFDARITNSTTELCSHTKSDLWAITFRAAITSLAVLSPYLY